MMLLIVRIAPSECVLFEHQKLPLPPAKPGIGLLRWRSSSGSIRVLRGACSVSRNRRDSNLLWTQESVDNAHVFASLRTAETRKADKKARPQGETDETYQTRFRGRHRCRYCRTPHHRKC